MNEHKRHPKSDDNFIAEPVDSPHAHQAETTGVAFSRILKSGWISFKRNPVLSIGATGVMTLTLLVFSGLLMLNFFTAQTVNYFNDKVDITAYFKLDAKEDQVLKIQNDLQKLPTVKEVGYVSPDQALAEFKEKHKNNQVILDSLEELGKNPLAASLNIRATERGEFKEIADFLEGHDLRAVIDKINYQENQVYINRIQAISRGLSWWGLLTSLFLIIVAVLVMFNTIRFAIYNQAREIEIMRLVGASNWHIGGPFMMAGVLYGLFASAVTLIIFYPLVYFITRKLVSLDADIAALNLFGYFVSHWYLLLLAILGAGLVLGIGSSLIAIRRHLKV